MKKIIMVAISAMLSAALFLNAGCSGDRNEKSGESKEQVSVTPFELTVNGIKFEMMPIKAGSFVMDLILNEEYRVTLTKDFYMGKYEVTQEQWEAIMGSNPSHFKGARRPVEQVSWNDAQEFIEKLNAQDAVKRSGMKFRLPTEAEWEYACRAGTKGNFSFGESAELNKMNYSGSETKDVGSYAPNAWGLHDMHGNVFEWCEDWYGYYDSAAVTDPKGAPDGNDRVLRGGSWGSDSGLGAMECRSSHRSKLNPAHHFNNTGFRLVLASLRNEK